jgi:cytochrome c553
MKVSTGRNIGFAASLASLLAFAAARPAAAAPPAWAYGTEVSAASAAAAKTAPKPKELPADRLEHLPGSSLSFTRAQASDRFGPGDWFPNDHPKMPEIVAHGRKPDIWACSLCHYPNGRGRPENAGVSGLPVSYFIHQMNDFRDGLRKSADPNKKNTALMAVYAKAMTDDEIKQAAEYFGAIKWTPWIKVVETRTVPKTHLSVGMFLPIEGAGNEPLGDRIIETPVNPIQTEELRNSQSGFIAYAPIGSIKKGKALVTTGAGKTVACAVCHGADLKGIGPVPGIAGRSPSYLVRELYDMQQGTRKGEWTELMKSVVANLSQDDMLNIAAYSASRQP